MTAVDGERTSSGEGTETEGRADAAVDGRSAIGSSGEPRPRRVVKKVAKKVAKKKVAKRDRAPARAGTSAVASGARETPPPWTPGPTASVPIPASGAVMVAATSAPASARERSTSPAGERSTSPRTADARRSTTDWVARLLVEPDAQGPRMRLGVLWFVLLIPAVWFGAGYTAALFGLLAAIAALQARQAWRQLGYWASRALAAPAALALPWLAVVNEALAGAALIMLPVLALLRSVMTGPPRRRVSIVAAAGVTLRCAVPGGLAAMGMVLAHRTGPASAVVLVILVSAYDVGCFLFGAEARTPVWGIIGGGICTLALAAPMWAFQLPPFDGRVEVFVYAGLVAVTAPLGQLAASLALPRASTWAPALRRLDAYIITAPLWAWSLTSYLL